MKIRSIIAVLLLAVPLVALADRTVTHTWSTAQSKLDHLSCDRSMPDGGWVASVSGTVVLANGSAIDMDTMADAGVFNKTDTIEVGPVGQCGTNINTLAAAWKANRGL
jgi:hypothetical protein